MTMHWREGVTDVNTMRGIAVAAALESKPGFSVDDVIVRIVMPNVKVSQPHGGSATPL